MHLEAAARPPQEDHCLAQKQEFFEKEVIVEVYVIELSVQWALALPSKNPFLGVRCVVFGIETRENCFG